MNDDEGVLGRLPRSRPGTRSEKRAETSRPAQKSPPSESRPAAGAARGRKAASAGAARGAKPPPAPPPHSPPPPRGQGGDPIAGAVRATVKVAEGGVKLAGGLTRELLRRLPRP